jgi:segregation and condensation protein B
MATKKRAKAGKAQAKRPPTRKEEGKRQPLAKGKPAKKGTPKSQGRPSQKNKTNTQKGAPAAGQKKAEPRAKIAQSKRGTERTQKGGAARAAAAPKRIPKSKQRQEPAREPDLGMEPDADVTSVAPVSGAVAVEPRARGLRKARNTAADDVPAHAEEETGEESCEEAEDFVEEPPASHEDVIPLQALGDAVPESDEPDLDAALDFDAAEPPVAAEAQPDEDAVEDTGAYLKGLIEAILFVSDKPLDLKELARAAKIDRKRTQELLDELRAEYRSRGITIEEVAGGFSFRSSPQYSTYVRGFLAHRPVRLTRAQLETLAIVAYRQPITRPEIDDVRGVDCGPVLKGLLERDLIRILGKKDEAGRPMLYGTTPQFLELFNLTSLSELPTLKEFTELSDESRQTFESETGESAPDPSLFAAVGTADSVIPESGELAVSEDELGSIEPPADLEEARDSSDEESDDDDEESEGEKPGEEEDDEDDESDDEGEESDKDDEDDEDDEADDEDEGDDEDDDEDEAEESDKDVEDVEDDEDDDEDDEDDEDEAEDDEDDESDDEKSDDEKSDESKQELEDDSQDEESDEDENEDDEDEDDEDEDD